MTIDIAPVDGVRYVSYLVNAVVILYWLKHRVVLNDFLAGRWEGVLTSQQGITIVYSCILYTARHDGRDNTAHLYYSKKNVAKNEVAVQGLDTLVKYNEGTFVFSRQWNPQFMRLFHNNIPSEMQAAPPLYDWSCKIHSIFFSAKMEVTIQAAGENLTFSGFLTKT